MIDIELELAEIKKRVEKLEALLEYKYEAKAVQDTMFPMKEKTPRDKTRYMFDGKVLSKNRLVLVVVKQYVKDNAPDYSQLQHTFDKSLQGSLGVVEKIENAKAIKDSAKRYFMDDSFVLKDGTEVVVCTQWGIFNIVKFIKQANLLGYKIDEIKLH